MIGINALCVRCLVDKHTEAAHAIDPVKAVDFCREMLELVKNGVGCSNSSCVDARINDLYVKHFGLPQDRYVEEKRKSNAFVVPRLPAIRALVEQQPDPVFAALQFAILGNYLDFSALKGQVSFEKLEDMLKSALSMELDKKVYESFCAELSVAKTLLYITDNAGEIGFDRVLAQQLQRRFPHLTITFCVRGLPALNDATRADAACCGIEFPIVDTGNDIGGVDLPSLGKEARDALHNADVILTKGMGNVETLYGCGLNIYYAFLVKCPRLMEVFQKPLLTPMFIKEKNG